MRGEKPNRTFVLYSQMEVKIDMDSMRIYQGLPTAGSTGVRQRTPQAATVGAFADILQQVDNRVTFSKHAAQRMEMRGISCSDQDLARLDTTVDRMAAKGARESLIYLNDTALVVSIPQRTVVTAVDGANAKENIFTNIDSAAIL